MVTFGCVSLREAKLLVILDYLQALLMVICE